RTALALIITRTRPNRIDMAPIIFGLGMDVRVAIDLRRGCLENFCPQTLGESQHVDRAMDAGLRRLYWIVLVVNGRSRAGEVVDLIDLDIERKGHVVPNKLEPMMVEQMINVALRASEEIVDAYDVPTISEQSLTEMRAEKAGSPGNQYACFKMHTPEFLLLSHHWFTCHIGRQFPTS